MSGTAPMLAQTGMTRSTLKLAIMAWLHRASLRTPVSDTFDAADAFIGMAEQDLNEKLRARCMVVRASQLIDGQYTTLPCDFLELVDARLAGGGPPLTFVTRQTTANAYWQHTVSYPDSGSDIAVGNNLYPDFTPVMNAPAYPWGDGTPRRYTIIGGEVEWSPFPAAPAVIDPSNPPLWPVVEWAYYQRCNLGVADSDTNSVLTTYPSIYIYGSLIQAAPFLRDDSRVPLWTQMYDNAVGGANREHERARQGAGSPLNQTYRRLA